MSENILILASAATTIVKLLVDALRIATPLPSWAPVSLALILSPLVVLLLFVAEGQIITGPLVAQAILAGLLAAGGAIGVTQAHDYRQQVKFRRRLDK